MTGCANFWRAVLETRSFSFEAYGQTEAQARRMLRGGWLRHRSYTGATITWQQLVNDGDVIVYEVGFRKALRDRQPFYERTRG